MIDQTYLRPEDRAVLSLRSLYRQYGYLPFKMSKFEEYDLYVQNKDFLVSDRIITFNDMGGKLLALKPDVTLSIIKNVEDRAGCKQKVCYSENVYRVSPSTHHFKEIMQTGLECIGDIDTYDLYEVISLAAASLACISESYVLDISHLGVLSAILDGLRPDETLRREIARCVGEKNAHDLRRVCEEHRIGEEDTKLLCDFVGVYGSMDEVLDRLEPICKSHEAATIAVAELTALRDHLRTTPYADHVRFDFSIMNDMNYYNGMVFRGFLDGICEGVLSGGQYNKLMRRMGHKSGAVGFALYLDLLESLPAEGESYDVDVLLLYDTTTPSSEVAATVASIRESGKTVSAQRAIPDKLRYREVKDIRKEASV